MWRTEETKCVVKLSQPINNIKGAGENKCINYRIVYMCPNLFLYTMESLHYVELLKHLYILQITCTLIDFKRVVVVLPNQLYTLVR